MARQLPSEIIVVCLPDMDATIYLLALEEQKPMSVIFDIFYVKDTN
jgi:hypothetical protein